MANDRGENTTGRSILIRDVVLFTPEGRKQGDCLVEDGKIANLGHFELQNQPDEVIDGAGRWLWPGAIDGHVHFREPGPTHKEDWTTGSMAAVAGGVTTVFEMPNTSPTTTTIARLNEKREIAAAKSLCNFGLFFGAGPDNLAEIRAANGENVPGLKIFMGCSTGDLLVYREEDLEPIFATWAGRICVHAESELRLRERARLFADREDPAVHSEIRDPESAAEAVRLAVKLAIKYGRDLHVLHLSTRAELAALEAGREQVRRDGLGIRLSCEVCPHHLFFNTDAYAELGTKVRVNPPIRDEADREAMCQALRDGRIDMVATDHAPHTVEEKSRPYRRAPSGMPGVQTVLPMMLDAAHRGIFTHDEVLSWLCHAPADLYGLAGKGRLRLGADADLVLIDPAMRRVVTDADQFSRCHWTPWAGRELTGWPVLTLVNGHPAYQRRDDGPGQITGHPGLGREVVFS